MTEEIQRMLAAPSCAVVGASRDPEKFGALVYRRLKEAGKTVYAVNPSAEEVEGDRCYPSLSALPQTPILAVMVVPPRVTEDAVTECIRLGIKQIWMQPGAESEAAIAGCHANGIAVVSGGACIMVGLRTLKYQQL